MKEIKKELNKYIKDCLSKGHSLRAIHKALIKYGYEDYADELIRNYKLKKSISIAVPLLTVIFLIFGLFFFKSAITGFITIEKQFNYSDNVNVEFNENSEYIWIPEQNGALKSLRVSGSYKTEGNVRVYLEDEGIRHLIFDSKKQNESLAGITGLVILNESNKNNSILNETLNITPTNITDITIIDETINKTPIINESIGGITNKTITLNLEYKTDTAYDADNDGIGDIYGVVDLTVENSGFNFDAKEENLCTRWETYSVENKESTFTCYGNQNCCAFVDLLPSKEAWNEPLFLTYGLYGNSFNNDVSAQVMHVDYNLSLEAPYSEIYYSNWSELPVKFYDPFISFENICIETCSLSLNKSSYKLVIEVNNTVLKLDKVNYIIEKETSINNPPTLIKNISNITRLWNKNYTIDLNEYFFDEDNDTLIYDFLRDVDNISVFIDNNIATIIPDKDFVGTRFMFFSAKDSIETAVSNVFGINIIKGVEEQINRSKIVINKPVKWLKKVKLDEAKSNISVNITLEAVNITIKKIKDNIVEEIPEEKIKIKDKGKVKALKEYEIEKEIKKLEDKLNEEEDIEKIKKFENKISILKEESIIKATAASLITGNVILENIPIENSTEVIIEELVEEVEIEYYTAGPTSEEIEVSDYNKKIIISSEIHYKDILAFTNLPIEANSQAVKLYWLINNSRTEIEIDKYDTNDNGLVESNKKLVECLPPVTDWMA